MIVLGAMQRGYELMVVLRPDFGVEEKTVKELIMKLIGDRTIKTLSIMGKKRLAYPIKKQPEGVYAVAEISGAPIQIGQFEKQIKVSTDIVRYLLIGK